MFLKSAVNAARFLIASTALLLAMSQTGLPQIITDEATSQTGLLRVISDEAIDTLDEIVIYGAPTLRFLRDEVYEAESNFYELFNALNDGRQFDITCFYRSPVGSLIRRRVCEAYFVKNPPFGVQHWAYVRHKTRQMRKEMLTLVDKHADLHAALLEFSDAKQSFDSTFSNRCGNRFSICRQ